MNRLQPPSPHFLADLYLIPLTPESKSCTLRSSSSILQQRIQLLGSGPQNDWVQYLAWDKEDGHKLQLALVGSREFDQQEKLLGYTCVDQETYFAFVEITINGIGQAYRAGGECHLWLRLCLAVDADSLELDWKLQAISTSHPQESPGSRLDLVDTIQELETISRSKFAGQSVPIYASADSNQEDDLDDYWGSYGKDDCEASCKQESEAGSEDYYARYETQVETAIPTPEAVDSSGIKEGNDQERTFPALVPDVVRHAESSLRSLRRLCHAAALTDDQISAIFRKVMDETL